MKNSGIEWIGEIPKDWNIAPLKSIFKERKEKNYPIKTKEILSLTIDRGVIPYSEKGGGGNKAKEDLTAYKLTYPNDIVLNSMNVIAGAVGLSKYFGAVSPVYYTLYGDEKINCTSYFNDIFQTQAFQKSLLGLGNGIMMKESSTGKLNTIRMRIPMEKLKSVMLPVPPLHEQQAIANYLDEQVGKIDELITEQRIAIEKWKEYKQSLITETVTKGLNPDVEMKDSGIEWIGKIPKVWNVRPLRKTVSLRNEKKFMTKENVFIGLENIQSFNGKYIRTETVYDEGVNNIFKNGDVLFSKLRPYLTKALIPDFDGFCTGELIVFSSYSGVKRFLLYVLLSNKFIDVINSSTYGAKMPRANWDFIGNVYTPIPPINEQQAIVDFLDEKCSKIDESIEQKQILIKQLEEYKQSLIYECVTGKKQIIE